MYEDSTFNLILTFSQVVFLVKPHTVEDKLRLEG